MIKLQSLFQNILNRIALTSQKARKGFTLAELLIALLIIGEISTFTIPKIIHSQQQGHRKAVVKEAYAALSALLYQATLTGEVSTQSAFWAYLKANMNAVKFCEVASTEGCWSGGTDAGSNTPEAAGILLHSGAMITDIDSSAGPNERYWIDWNGTAGPNLQCDDQVPIIIYLQSSTRDGITGQQGQVRFSISPPGTGSANCSQAFYDELL